MNTPDPNPMTAPCARSDIREQMAHHSQKQDFEHHFALVLHTLASHNFITKIKVKDDSSDKIISVWFGITLNRLQISMFNSFPSIFVP